MGVIAITYRRLVLQITWLCMHSTDSLFVMAIAPTSHYNFVTFLTFLESFYILLVNRKQVLKQSEDFFFSPLVHTGKI